MGPLKSSQKTFQAGEIKAGVSIDCALFLPRCKMTLTVSNSTYQTFLSGALVSRKHAGDVAKKTVTSQRREILS